MTQSADREELRDYAGKAVRMAVSIGMIPALDGKIKCIDCGKVAVAYDHRNYYKPLEVEPVCKRCNGLRGAAIPVPENWGKPRAGNEAALPEEVTHNGRCLANVNEEIIDDQIYNAKFGLDPDIRIADNERTRLIKAGLWDKYVKKKKCIVVDKVGYWFEKVCINTELGYRYKWDLIDDSIPE